MDSHNRPITSLTPNMPTCDPLYNVNCELWEFRDHTYDILEFLMDIRLALFFELNIQDILQPQFDPFQPFEKFSIH